MEKTRKFVFVSLLVAGSLLFGKTRHVLSGAAAEGFSGRGSSGEAHHGASTTTGLIVGIGFVPAVSVAGHDANRTDAPTAGALVDTVVTNELADREKFLKWSFKIEKREGKQTFTEVQVETKDGPLYRMLAIDGTALNLDQRQQDDMRIGRLMKDSRPLLKLKQAQDEDELKLQKLVSLLPQAFVYEYDGVENNLLRLKFRPNPDYNPPTYEARVIHSLAGTVLIDPEQKRLAKVAGQMVNRVDFGYGLLGRIDSGTVEWGRVEVGPQEWKTAFINIHFSGRMVLFKTINKDQYERRSDFQEVSGSLSLSDAKELLVSRILPLPQSP
jgi:hypothetical protein